MPRKPLIVTDQYPYHVTNRSNNKEFFELPSHELWPLCIQVLKKVKKDYCVQTLSFVLMSNHYHWIFYTPELQMSEAMTYFHREVAKRSNKKTGRINHFFGGRYKWSIVNSENYFWNVVKYVYRNPVAAGICQRVEDFEYSSIHQEGEQYPWQMVDFFNDRYKKINLSLDWLNDSFSSHEEINIKKGLSKTDFGQMINRKKRPIVFAAQPYQKVLGTD